MTELITPISNHPVLNKTRAIRLKQISYIDFDIKEAQVIWEELFTDEKGEPIIDETVAKRSIVSHISNSNKVTMEGIVIDSENFPKLDEETDEEYQERFEGIKETGIPEFDFYIGAVLNVQAIGQAILILDSLNRFNRK
jgi:sporulation protein YlmC with PRC-barrel domain